jgi:hypothetical protein
MHVGPPRRRLEPQKRRENEGQEEGGNGKGHSLLFSSHGPWGVGFLVSDQREKRAFHNCASPF